MLRERLSQENLALQAAVVQELLAKRCPLAFDHFGYYVIKGVGIQKT